MKPVLTSHLGRGKAAGGLFRCALAAAALLLALGPPAGARTFTNSQGKTIEAEVVTVQGDRVRIRRVDGREFWVPIATLSEADQTYLKSLKTARSTPVPRLTGAVTRSDIEKIAEQIDKIVSRNYRANGVDANPTISDEAFLRRAYLNIVGRIPTYEEAEAFLEAKGNRRADLVDKLLDSEGHVSHMYNYWADILRVQSGMREQTGPAYVNWVKQTVRDNMPYDSFVKELLTADGYPWDNGAVGYYMRDEGMPLDNMSNTVQIFLGTQLVCAQCHDHPFDKWSQYQYYQMAAFTYGVQTRINPKQQGMVRGMFKGVHGDDRRYIDEAIGDLFQPVTYGVAENHSEVKLPHDYQYDNAKPHEVVQPKSMFGQEIEAPNRAERRQAYADWLASPENPRFTKVIANRLWKRAMGRGLFEPVDAITDKTRVDNPELLKFLEKTMVALGYDVRQFQRALFYTELFHREAARGDIDSEKPYHFPGPVLRRMSAEQLWDSMLAATIPSPDHRRGRVSRAYNAYALKKRAEALLEGDANAVAAAARKMAEIEKEADRRLQPIQEQILALQRSGNDASVESLRKEARDIRYARDRALSDMAFYGNMNAMGPEMMMSPDKKGDDDDRSSRRDERETGAIWKGYSDGLVRASELDSPAPRGHFLRQFGQSDREVIENASEDPSVTQILTLLNGPMFDELLKPTSVLSKNMAESHSPKKKVRTIYLSLLSREPTDDEYKLLLKETRKRGNREAAGDGNEELVPMTKGHHAIIWALLNTRRFAFVE